MVSKTNYYLHSGCVYNYRTNLVDFSLFLYLTQPALYCDSAQTKAIEECNLDEGKCLTVSGYLL